MGVLYIPGAVAMPDAKTAEPESTVNQRGGVDNSVDDTRRRTEYSDARQLLSETLRLRRAAQLQRDAAGETAIPATSPSAAVAAGLRRSATADASAAASTAPKRRKKVRHDRGSATDQPPRARRIMFHEYKGPSDDDPVTSTTTSAAPLTSTSLCFTSPRIMTTVQFSPVTAVWKDPKNEQTHDGGTSQSLASPLTTADFGGFCPTSSTLPRFSELQRSLRSPTHAAGQELVHPNHLQVTQRSQPAAVSCSSSAESVCRPCSSTLLDALFYRSVTTPAITAQQQPSTSSFSSAVELATASTQSQRCHPQSVTLPVDAVTSGLLTSGGLDHVITCFPSVTAAYRPNIGNIICGQVISHMSMTLVSRIPQTPQVSLDIWRHLITD